jgi:hippurate hydrolase
VCGVAAAHGVEVEVRYEEEYPVTVNDQAEAAFALGVAEDLFGAGAAMRMPNPITGSEDFSRILAEIRGDALPRRAGGTIANRSRRRATIRRRPRSTTRCSPQGSALYASLAARRLAQG